LKNITKITLLISIISISIAYLINSNSIRSRILKSTMVMYQFGENKGVFNPEEADLIKLIFDKGDWNKIKSHDYNDCSTVGTDYIIFDDIYVSIYKLNEKGMQFSIMNKSYSLSFHSSSDYMAIYKLIDS